MSGSYLYTIMDEIGKAKERRDYLSVLILAARGRGACEILYIYKMEGANASSYSAMFNDIIENATKALQMQGLEALFPPDAEIG